jgi:hypothetical protein
MKHVQEQIQKGQGRERYQVQKGRVHALKHVICPGSGSNIKDSKNRDRLIQPVKYVLKLLYNKDRIR